MEKELLEAHRRVKESQSFFSGTMISLLLLAQQSSYFLFLPHKSQSWHQLPGDMPCDSRDPGSRKVQYAWRYSFGTFTSFICLFVFVLLSVSFFVPNSCAWRKDWQVLLFHLADSSMTGTSQSLTGVRRELHSPIWFHAASPSWGRGEGLENN